MKPDDFVAMLTERSVEMLIGMIGILKSGAAYVPIDPTYPEDRIVFMLKDCNPKALLTYKTEVRAEVRGEIPVIDLADRKVFEGMHKNLKQVSKPENLAYCLYTSGTTGQPKGVMICQESVTVLCKAFIEKFNLQSGIRTLQHTNVTFDPFVEEVFPTLLSGATIVMTSEAEKENYEKLWEYMNQKRVELADFSPIVLAQIVPYLKKEHYVKQITCGGESLPFNLKNEVLQMGIELFNHYGPTEITVDATSYKCEHRDGNIIGKPFAGKKAYIISDGMLCGIGVPGELCIAGEGLARGYLNRPELTAEKFVTNPFGEGRMYCTGDLARWLPDGNIEYLGRIDEQVKIRGFRIELGEIESRICEIEGVKECAVITREDKSGEKALYAYYTGNDVSVSEIRESLKNVLPSYMIPAYMMQIATIPVTANGKVDKKALPDILPVTAKQYEGPEDEFQMVLLDEMKELLQLEEVGINDDFFEIGGNSIKATLASMHLNKKGYKISVKEIMSLGELREIAKRMKLHAESKDEQM